MLKKPHTIYVTVSNDLNQDQRMHRICSALTEMGHDVVLIGREKTNSQKLLTQPFAQKRLKCFFHKRFLFYAEYNLRLLFYLLWHAKDIVYSVDTDTLLAGWWVKKLQKIRLIFDAHEYFIKVPELLEKPKVRIVWSWIENLCIKDVDLAITVSPSLASIFTEKWNKPFETIYNVPKLEDVKFPHPNHSKKYILYQGILNTGRGLAEMMDALSYIHEDIDFIIIGEGDLSQELRNKAINHEAADRIHFLGWKTAQEMKAWTQHAFLGYNLLQIESLSYYYSLANKFFDYMHAEIPSVSSDVPEYRRIIDEYEIGYLVEDLDPKSIANTINKALNSKEYLEKKKNCKRAKEIFNWDKEKMKLGKIMEKAL